LANLTPFIPFSLGNLCTGGYAGVGMGGTGYAWHNPPVANSNKQKQIAQLKKMPLDEFILFPIN
jgi:hypothetical protein